MKMLKLSLFQKIEYSVVVTVSVFSFVAVYLAYSTAIDYRKENDMGMFLKISVALSKEVGHKLSDGVSTTHAIAAQEKVRAYMLSKNPSLNEKTEVLGLMESRNLDRAYSAFFLLNGDGTCILSTDQSFVGENFGFRNYFKTAIKGGSGVDAGVGVISRRMGYYFSFPVYTQDGSRIIGVAVSKLEPLEINNILESSEYGVDANVMITNDNGVILYSSKEDVMFWSLGKLSEQQMEVEKTSRFVGRKIDQLTYDLVEAEIAEYSTPAIFEIYDKRDGENEVISVTRAGEFPFYIVTEVGSVKFFQHIVDQNIRIAVLLISSLIFIFISSSILIFLILKPIKDILAYINKTISRDRQARLDVKSGDEFEEIADGIKTLVNRKSQ